MKKDKEKINYEGYKCFECAYFDDCKYTTDDGDMTVCNKFKEARFQLTPKGIWIAVCITTLGDGGNDVDIDFCERFFEKYNHNMYACGLIQDNCKTRLGLILKMWFKDLKNVFTGKKRMNSKDVLIETMKDDEFEGTIFSDEDIVFELYGKFIDGMKKNEYVI